MTLVQSNSPSASKAAYCQLRRPTTISGRPSPSRSAGVMFITSELIPRYIGGMISQMVSPSALSSPSRAAFSP